MRKKVFFIILPFLFLLGFSFSSGDCPNIEVCQNSPEIGILQKGFPQAMGKLLGRFGHGKIEFGSEFDPEVAMEKMKALVLPTGSLYGEEGNEALRVSLEEYIKIRRWGC